MKYFKTIIGIVAFASVVSCSPKLISNSSALPKVFYPEVEDSAKIQFLTSYSYVSDIEENQSKFNEAIVGKQKDYEIKKPYGVEIHNNKLYVCDIGIGGLIIIDLDKKSFNSFNPQGNGSLKMPVNSFVDEQENLYVADITQKKIFKYDPDGKYLLNFGLSENKAPSDVFVKNDKIWVCDSKSNRINVYQKDNHKFLDYFPKNEESGDEGWLYMPSNIFVANNMVYVSDMGSGSVKEYTLDGDFIKSIGSFGKNTGQFVRPKGVVADNDGNIYVVDGSFSNTQIFNSDGALLLFFGGATGDRGGMYLPTSITIDYNTAYFQKFVDPKYDLKYIILVANQYGPYKINVYGQIALKK